MPISKKEENKLLRGLNVSKKSLQKGTKAYNTKLNKAVTLAVKKLFDIEGAFGMFGMPNKLEDVVDNLHQRFKGIITQQVEKIVKEKLEEYTKNRQLEPICPVCRAFGDMIEDNREGNGVFGPGHRSWHTNYSCKRCGVVFNTPKQN